MNLRNYKVDREALLKNYAEARNDEMFYKLTSSIDLPDEKKMHFTSSFEESAAELKNCMGCKSINECKNKVKGFVYYPEKRDNLLKFDYVACKYEKEILADEENSCEFFEMPESYRHASMKELKIDDAKRVPCIKWLKKFYDNYQITPKQKGLYLYGSFGSGKTYMVVALLNELAKKGVDIVVVYYPELLRSLKESFDTDFSARINRLKKCDILFLDDIGAESVTAWARDEILGTILQYRMDEMLPTFFTSNLNLEELEVHLSSTKNDVDKVKARRIIERIKQVSENLELISKNRRN